MGWLAGVGLVAAVGLLAGLAYWAIVVTEGAYLGRWLVVWLYDRGARHYDDIKGFDLGDEAWFLGQPLERALSKVPHPLVLDVATGTGRLPLALLRRLSFDGAIVGLDLSLPMLRQARSKTAGYGSRVTLVRKDATVLPFFNGVFDAVTCIEALEFLPDPRATLEEMVRVLQPGGVCLLTNRTGRDARLFFGRRLSRDRCEGLLQSLGLDAVETLRWQADYDLVWARKPGQSRTVRRTRDATAGLCCPGCGMPLDGRAEGAYHCPGCQRGYPVRDGIVLMEG